MLTERPPLIAVLGPETCTPEQRALGLETGRRLALAGAMLLCGGRGGMMEAAAEGARQANGQTIALLPGDDSREANAYIDVALPTGLGPFRNLLIARACHAAIALFGGYGTLSEISFCLRLNTPVIGLHTWSVHREDEPPEGILVAADPEDAVARALDAARERLL